MPDQKVFDKNIISPTALICGGAIIGKPFRPLLNDPNQEELIPTIIEDKVYIGYYSIIGTGSSIKAETIIDDFCIVESRVMIGYKNLLIYRAQVCNNVQTGDNCVIGGFIGEGTWIGNRCRIFGQVIHLQHNPKLEWDDDASMEESPTIKDNVFIGFGAKIIGGITIGTKSYICSNAVITKNVPDFHVGFGKNNIVHYSEWAGKLKNSPFFQNW